MPDVTIHADRIAEGAAALGLDLAPDTCARLAAYGALLLRWNRRINLLARGAGPDEVIERHLLDAVALLRIVRPAGRVADVGAGAGLPGLPLWIAAADAAADAAVDTAAAQGGGTAAGGAAATLTCVEPTAKRTAFLRAAARELGLADVTVRGARVEALPADERFDLLLSRATFAPPEWVAVAAARRAEGGRIVAMLAQTDTAAVAAAAAARGLRVLAEDGFALPWSGAARRNVVVGA